MVGIQMHFYNYASIVAIAVEGWIICVMLGAERLGPQQLAYRIRVGWTRQLEYMIIH